MSKMLKVLAAAKGGLAKSGKTAAWHPLTDEHINQEYAWEYPNVKRAFGDIWPTVEHFRAAVKGGTVTPIDDATDSRMGNRSHTKNLDQLKQLTGSYRFPRDVDRIANGLKAGESIPTPIVLRHADGNMHVMSGNTRMDTAKILGYQPHATVIDMPAKKLGKSLTEDYQKNPATVNSWRTRNRHFAKIEPLDKAEPNAKIRGIADSYAQNKGIKLAHTPAAAKVNPEFATKVAGEYANMKHDPNHPETKKAYDSLIGETTDQLNHLQAHGLKFSKIPAGGENPYKNGSKDLIRDLNDNNHVWYYPTENAFGSTDAPADHPLLRHITTKNGDTMPANDAFRIVHDVFGHAKEGHGFGPNGEEGAFHHHSQMYGPEARRALASETRGQNSWVNFGPHGEHNRKNPSQTKYADQKAGLMPEWASGPAPSTDPVKKSLGSSDGWRGVFAALKKDDLEKGGAMKRYPYNPSDRSSESVDKPLHNWQQLADAKARETLPGIEGNGRIRALHKLAGKTKVKNTPEGRYFLLHRGMGKLENKKTVNADGLVNHDKHSSWTPDVDIASNFASEYGHDQGTNPGSGITSAWVHEKNIHTVPKQYGNYSFPKSIFNFDKKKVEEKWPENAKVKDHNEFDHEHEVVVKPGHKSALANIPAEAHPDENVKFKDLNARINGRMGTTGKVNQVALKLRRESNAAKKAPTKKPAATKKVAKPKVTKAPSEEKFPWPPKAVAPVEKSVLEKRSKNVREQTRNITEDQAGARRSQYIQKIGLKPVDKALLPKKPESYKGTPDQTGNTLVFNAAFPMEHEAAHAMMTPKGSNVSTYTKDMADRFDQPEAKTDENIANQMESRIDRRAGVGVGKKGGRKLDHTNGMRWNAQVPVNTNEQTEEYKAKYNIKPYVTDTKSASKMLGAAFGGQAKQHMERFDEGAKFQPDGTVKDPVNVHSKINARHRAVFAAVKRKA